MHQKSHSKLVLGLTFLTALTTARAHAFEGHISAITSRGGPPIVLRYTVGTNCLRIEMTDTNSPNTVDILDRNSGTLTLLFPQNRCFMQLKSAAENSSALPPGFPAMPVGPPPGIGPRAQPNNAPGAPGMPNRPPWAGPPGGMPPGIGPTNFPGMAGSRPAPSMPVMPGYAGIGSMPAMPMLPPGGGLTLQATAGTTNLLGYTCARYEIKQWGQTMEIWATDQLFPFQVYLPNQPPRVGPPIIELQWSDLLAAKKLFPLLASLRFDNGVERYRFEVQSILPARLTEQDAKRFQTPEDYVELQPRPF